MHLSNERLYQEAVRGDSCFNVHELSIEPDHGDRQCVLYHVQGMR
jgi:hypothetical protein